MKLKKLSLFCQVLVLSWILVPAHAIFAYNISGKVKTETGAVVPGVYVTLSGPVSKIIKTDADGNYKFSNLPNGSYTVTPNMVDYFFTPPGRSVMVNGANKPGQNLTGTATLQEKGILKGEYCWDIVNETKGYNGTVKLSCFHIGNDHHLCSGAATVSSYGSFPLYGNAEIVDGQIYLTYSLAGQRNGIIGNDLVKAVLDRNSLNGTFKAIGVYLDDEVNDGTAVVELTHSGTFSKTTCE